MIRPLPDPMERLASTNSFCLSDSVFPRTTRATYGHENRTITAMTIVKPGWISPWRQPSLVVLQAATMPIEMSSCGTASMTSAPRESVVSAQRPKKPASSADERADSDGDAGRDDSDEQRGAGAVHRADEEISTRDVGAEPERRIRPLREVRSRPSLSEYGSFWACPVTRSASGPPKIASEDQHDDHDAPDQSGLVLLETEPRTAAEGCGRDGDVDVGDGFDGRHRPQSRARRPSTARV